MTHRLVVAGPYLWVRIPMAQGATESATDGFPVRRQRLAVLEGEDRRGHDQAVLNLDRAPDGGVGLPGVGAGHHDLQERRQRLPDLPGRGVPEIGRTVVDGVVLDMVANLDDRLVEAGRARPAEAHPLVARDVDDQAS